MPIISILHRVTRVPLLSGPYEDPAAALPDAAARGLILRGADLRGVNLSNAMLDGLVLEDADLSGANLNGANLSEGALTGCILRDVTLYGACVCYTALTDVDLSGALCGGTDIAGARLVRCLFSTLSGLQMNFHEAGHIAECAFHDEAENRTALFSRPPVAVNGLSHGLVVLDDDVKIGPHVIPRSLWMAIANDNVPGLPGTRPDSLVYSLIRRHGGLLAALRGMPAGV